MYLCMTDWEGRASCRPARAREWFRRRSADRVPSAQSGQCSTLPPRSHCGRCARVASGKWLLWNTVRASRSRYGQTLFRIFHWTETMIYEITHEHVSKARLNTAHARGVRSNVMLECVVRERAVCRLLYVRATVSIRERASRRAVPVVVRRLARRRVRRSRSRGRAGELVGWAYRSVRDGGHCGCVQRAQ